MMNLPDEPIALGRTAELYAWKNGRVLKLFFDWFELENIQFERRMEQAVHTAGLPVPVVGEILQINGLTDCFTSTCLGQTCGKFLKNNLGSSLLWRA